MTAVSGPRRLVGAAFTGAGALLFAWSLARTGQAYVWDFGMGRAPWSVDAWPAVASNTAWFALFALHHSLFARPRVRAWVAAIVSADFERSVYVWMASLLLLAVVLGWTPVPGLLWQVSGFGAIVLVALQLAGVTLTLISAAQLGIGRLSGSAANSRRRRPTSARLVSTASSGTRSTSRGCSWSGRWRR